MHTRYEPERVSLPGVPELDSIIPTAAYQLVRGPRVEASAEDSGLVAVHHVRRIAAFFKSTFNYTGCFVSFFVYRNVFYVRH